MTELRPVYRHAVTQVHRIRTRAAEVDADARLTRWRRRALTEVLVSDLWQAWNEFVRDILIASCAGCVTRSGVIVAARPGLNSWQRISYEAKAYATVGKTGTPIKKLKAKWLNSHRYQDPTWGDLDHIVDVVNGLAPANLTDLRSAFGATARGLKDLQTVRNACFHKNRESWDAVKDAETVYFSSSDTRDPSDLAWKTYLGKTTPSFYDWTDAVTIVCASASK